MEGVAGVATLRHVIRGTDDYPYYRRLMTLEAAAAAEGALAGGAEYVLINDSHGEMSNLLIEDLPEGAEFLTGAPKPGGMTAGLDETFDCCMFVGYHARAGTEAGILDHTYAGVAVLDARVNGESWGEGEINAAWAGRLGVPLALVTGDDKACAQIGARVPGVRTVEVKRAVGRHAAISMHPAAARRAIRAAAAEAVRGVTTQPLRTGSPLVLEVDFTNTAVADAASQVPGAQRIGPRSLRQECTDIVHLLAVLGNWIGLGIGQAFRYPV